MDGVAISAIARECWQSFGHAISILPPALGAFNTTFHPIDLFDAFEQFRAWSSNIGVFAQEQASLDYRLREISTVRQTIVDFLRRILNNLVTACLLAAHPEQTHRIDNDAANSEDDNEDNSDSSASASARPQPSDSWTRFQKELVARLKDVVELNNKLMALSRAIRKAGVDTRSLRAATYEHWENGINLTTRFQDEYLPALLEFRFGIKDPNVRSVLGKALSQRRRRFDYQRTHQQKLAYGAPPSDQMLPVRFATQKTSREVERPHANSEATWTGLSHALEGLSIIQPTTVATKYTQSTPLRSAKSSITQVTSRASTPGTKLVDLPDPPTIKETAQFVECPYCTILLPKSSLEKKAWKRHVIADLRPYICLEADCTAPERDFTSIDDWFEHHRWQHSLEWWCDGSYLPELMHDPQQFLEEADFIHHISTDHATQFTGLELSAISKMSSSPSVLPFRLCPFCDVFGSKETTDSQHAAVGTVEGHGPVTPDIFKRHMVYHFLHIFLVALPERSDLQDAKSSIEADSVSERSTLNDLDEVQLLFSDVNEDSTEDYINENEKVMYEEVEKWTSETRAPYPGHALDKTLHPFISAQIQYTQAETETLNAKAEQLITKLRTMDSSERFRVFRKDTAPGSCQWLLDHPVYKDWAEGQTSLVTLTGGSSDERSILYAAVVESLSRRVRDQDGNTCLLHETTSFPMNEGHVLQSLLSQLLTTPTISPTIIIQLLDQHFFWLSEVPVIFHKLLPSFECVYLVVDGADDSSEFPPEFLSILSQLPKWKPNPLKIFLTRRKGSYYDRLHEYFPDVTTIDIDSEKFNIEIHELEVNNRALVHLTNLP